MKLTAFLLVVAFLQVSAGGYAQTVTLHVRDATLQQVFREISRQTGVDFFYNDDLLAGAKKVTVDVVDAPLARALDECFQGQQLEFVLRDGGIVVRKREVEAAPVDTGRGGTIKVKGVVLTEAGVPVQGANVTVKQTEKGTITNPQGEFQLSYAIPVGSVLIFSYVGYAPQSFAVKDGAQIRIYMKVAQNELDKAVVQAYGTTTQRLTTADIGKVTAEEIERQPVMNSLLALQGRVAGLDITQTSGFASAPVKVELRGRASISNFFTSDPLYIVDGVPLTVLEISDFGSNLYATGSPGFLQSNLSGPANGQSPLFSINPADIESIEVLKDADATAIYGSRGANGVILITTKSGKVGKTNLDLHVQEGITKVTRYYDLMNTQQYLSMRREALANDGIAPSVADGDYDLVQWDTTKYTNWQKVLFGGMGKAIDAQGALSGGNAQTSFRIGAGFNRTTNILTVSGADQRASVSFNLSHATVDQKLRISFSSQYNYTESNMISIAGAAALPPDAPPVYDSAGNLNYAGWGIRNSAARFAYPFNSLKQPYDSKTNFLNTSISFSYQPCKGLTIGSNLGYNNAMANQQYFQLIAAQDPLSSPNGNANYGISDNKNWIIEPQITYSTFIGRGKLNFLAGGSVQQTNTDGTFIGAHGYSSDLLIHSISFASSTSSVNNIGEYKYAGIFSRLTYTINNEFIVNLNGRRDGSSRFGPGKQFGDFGSVGLAWILTEEGWFNSMFSWLSFFKVHGSYGLTGSDAVGDYQYLTRLASNGTPYDGITAIVPTQQANSNYHWATNKKLEGSVDLGFLKDRIHLNVAYYRDRSGDQLVSFPTPSLSGFSSVTANSPALVQNSGWEFTGVAKIIETKNVRFSLNVNGAFNTNKLVSYPNFLLSPYVSTLIIGKPLNIVQVFHALGVDPQTGNWAFQDMNHDGRLSQTSPTQPGDTYPITLNPKFMGGMGMDFGYKSLQLSLFFVARVQKGQNGLAAIGNGAGSVGNQPAQIYGKEWKQPGDIASIAKFTTQFTVPNAIYQVSDQLYTDASFIRLSGVSISYGIPHAYLGKIGMKDCRLFFHTNDLFVITRYKGADPETQNFGGMPPVRTVVGGVNFNF